VSEDRRVAVVDLGSNSFRLVVFTARDGWWKRTDEIYEPVRIGEGMGDTGRIAKKPAARALAAIEVFAHFCTASRIGRRHVDAVATSAIREASNSEEFLKRARDATFMPIRVLSREEEARYGYLAAVNSTTLSDGTVLDLGGGSMQLVSVKGRHATELASWRLGAVHVTERFLANGGPASRKQLREVRAHVERELESAPWIGRSGSRLVGIGGTVRNLAAAAQRHVDLPSFGVQGHVITRAVLDDLIERLAALPPAERGSVPGIKPARADLILAGALVVQSVLEAGDFEGIEATEAGLREGVFFERLPAGPDDPPLFEDVRRASVLNLAAQYNVDPAHTAHVSHLALGLFDELAAAGLHAGDPHERELLWAACVLHDIGVTIDYDDHHKHSRYLILNGGLPGYSPAEVALIAQIARYHRKGTPDLGPFRSLARKGDAERLTRCATLVRLAEGLERSRDQMVEQAHVSVADGEVRLDLVAQGDATVARWAAAREVELFELAFDRRLIVAD
jgi:exopolyphosphatase/guanosine-5'-triphosphate,3'-diphosphate pyrophosphatase